MESGIFNQGLWSFPNFSAYLNQWIIPNMLKDLETVFEGACEKWLSEGEPENGRGDFVLATGLFALFDHLGAFLAEGEDFSLHTRENISRTAGLLNSIKDVNLIVAHFGRNALIHGAWPQTAMLMDNETWAFGLNIHAHPNENTHKELYKRKYEFFDKNNIARTFEILKLRLNVRFLRRELEDCIRNNPVFTNIKPEVFKRVQKIAIDAGRDPWGDFFKQRNGKSKFTEPKIALKKQIKSQLDEAKKQGKW